MHQAVSTSKRTVSNHVLVNGWQFDRRVTIVKGLISSHYRHPETKWTAREIYRGPRNDYVGLLIQTETGKNVGIVQSVKDLP